MPLFCENIEEARKALGHELHFPVMLIIWNADEIRDAYLHLESDEPLLTPEQANHVLAHLTKNHDCQLGITNDRIWNACNHLYPICNKCHDLKKNCDCVDLPDDYADIVGAAIGKSDYSIEGWSADWEYPGFVEWKHKDYSLNIQATPWWECEEMIPINVSDSMGNIISGLSIPLKPTGDVEKDVDAYHGAMEVYWPDIKAIIDRKLVLCKTCGKHAYAPSVKASGDGLTCEGCQYEKDNPE
jgi:hypothetical protein